MNSLVEFINDKCLGETDDTPEDEDDDIPDSNKCGGKEGIEDHIYVFLVFQLPVFFDNTNTKIPIRDDGKFVFTFIALHYSPPEIGYSLLG